MNPMAKILGKREPLGPHKVDAYEVNRYQQTSLTSFSVKTMFFRRRSSHSIAAVYWRHLVNASESSMADIHRPTSHLLGLFCSVDPDYK